MNALSTRKLLIGVFLLTLIPIGLTPFSTKGEAREALVVKDMIKQGEYVLPLRNGVEIPSKPLLFHWTAALVSQFGISEFTIRLPSVLYSILALGVFAVAVSSHARKELVILSLLICISSFEWLRSSEAARVDMTFTGALTVALISLYKVLTAKDSPSTLSVIGLAVGLAAATLAKGPAGFAIPFIVAVCFAGKSLFARLLPLAIAGAAGGALALVWYYLAYLKGGQHFLDVQFFKENVSRLMGDGKFDVGHERAFYWAPVELFLGFLPWSLLFPGLVGFIIQQRGFLKGSFERFALTVILVFLVILLVVSSKRPVYFLPVFTFLSYLSALYIQKLNHESLVKRCALVWFLGAIGVATAVVPLVQRANGTVEFSKVVSERVGSGEKVYQLRRDYFPILYYSATNLPLLSEPEKLPAGSLGILPLEEASQAKLPVVIVSSGNADDGRRKLALVTSIH